MEFKMTRGEEYALKRKRKGLHLTKIAQMMNCSHTTLSKWERNYAKMSDKKVRAYENIINCYDEKTV